MRIVYDHDPAHDFYIETIGEPGSRQFFFVIESELGQTVISSEKEQVIALIERLEEILREIRIRHLNSKQYVPTPLIVHQEIPFPVEESFHAGLIGITWIAETEQISIEIQEYSSDPEFQELLPIGDEIVGEYAPDIAGACLEIGQVKNFISESKVKIDSGRQPCPFCGLPIDLSGHLCPRANGYRR